MSLLILSAFLLSLICLGILVHAVRCAPNGFEDETGFRFDQQPARARHALHPGQQESFFALR